MTGVSVLVVNIGPYVAAVTVNIVHRTDNLRWLIMKANGRWGVLACAMQIFVCTGSRCL